MNRLAEVATRTGLLKEDAYPTVDVGIGRSLAVVKIVEALFVVVETPDLIEAVSSFSIGTALIDPSAFDQARISLLRRLRTLGGHR